MSTETTLKKKKFAVVGVDGYGRIVEILDMSEVDVRNRIHQKNLITEIETKHNDASNELKAKRLAKVKVLVVTTFKKVKVDDEAVGLNVMFRTLESKRQANTQAYLKYKKEKDEREAREREAAEKAKTAIVKYNPGVLDIVLVK